MKNVSPLQPGETDRRSQVHPSCWEGHSRRWMPLQLPRFNELARNGRSPATTTRNTKTVDDDDPFPRSRRRRLPFSTSSCSKMDGYRFVSPIIIIKKRIRRPKFSTDRSPPASSTLLVQETAEREAQRIVAVAIQRFSSSHAGELMTSTVTAVASATNTLRYG